MQKRSITLTFSDECQELSKNLSKRSNNSEIDVFNKALALFEVAIEAIEQGQKLAILNQKDEVISVITGICDEPK